MRRRSLFGLAPGSLLLARAPSVHASGERRVVIQPLGPGSAPLAAPVSRALGAIYDLDVTVAAVAPLPAAAYYPARRRFRAERLLEHLAVLASGAFRVLGITAADISTTKGNIADWGILGLASIEGRTCVLSSFRCYRSARDSFHATARLGKTAVHELGHTLGLEHCPTRGCLMQDGGGTVLTTDGERDLCSLCRGKLSADGLLRAGGRSPWA